MTGAALLKQSVSRAVHCRSWGTGGVEAVAGGAELARVKGLARRGVARSRQMRPMGFCIMVMASCFFLSLTPTTSE